MHPALAEFVREHCLAHPGHYCPIRDFALSFCAHTESTPRQWPRGRVIAELSRAGYEIARTSTNTTVVAGLALKEPPPYRVENGRFVRQ